MAQSTNWQPALSSGEFTIGSDMPVRRMGFGAMRITGPGIWGEPTNREEALAVLKRAIELGINFIDTADSYGPNTSEQLIAEALYPYPKDLVIATKGGHKRGGPDNWYTDGRPEHLREALDGSLRRLKLERIDLYQFHRPDPAVPFEESVGAVADLQQEGKIRHVGLSNVSVAQLESAQKIVPIVTVQNRYNLTDRTSEDVLKACEKANIGFIPWYPLGAHTARLGDKLDQIAKSHNATTAQIVLAWLLHHSPVMLPIPGTSTLKHLEENTSAAEIKLTDEELAALGA
jgi:aryl-alcohol dehydrogenase-like predicted oxidoreductase